MFAQIKQVATIGAAVAGIGWPGIASLAAAYAQPPQIPPGNDVICPDIAGVQYVLDPENSNAYYVCEDGSQQQHDECPEITKLDMAATPPKCFSNQDMYHP
jgi:hypothetical protein